MSWGFVFALGVTAFAFKVLGLVLVGDREMPPVLDRCLALIPAALIAAIVVKDTFSIGQHLQLDARAVGVGAAAIAAWRKLPLVAVIVIARGFPGAEAALIGPGKRRRVESVREGTALFLGLVPATYEVQIRERGRLEVTRQITIHGPVLADLEIAEFSGSEGSGGGR